MIKENSKWIWLSHMLNDRTPTYGNEPGFSYKPDKSIKHGDSCNTSIWTLPNHTGTHIDLPSHFFSNGSSIDDYTPEFWIFQKITMIYLPLTEGKWIEPNAITINVPNNTELLLIKTDFEKYREDAIYTEDNPGLSPELAEWLRKEKPNVRVVGMDFISVSRWRDRKKGRKAHKCFLNPEFPGNPILLIEDMSMDGITPSTTIKNVLVVPMRVSGADGVPCTVMAEVSQ